MKKKNNYIGKMLHAKKGREMMKCILSKNTMKKWHLLQNKTEKNTWEEKWLHHTKEECILIKTLLWCSVFFDPKIQIHKWRRNHLKEKEWNRKKRNEKKQIDIKCQNKKNTRNKLSMRKCSILFKNKNQSNSMKTDTFKWILLIVCRKKCLLFFFYYYNFNS